MKGIEIQEPREKFKFLDEKTANEPHIYEVLNEILIYQENSLPRGEKPLASMKLLQNSRKIKIPFTTTRSRTIEYLIDILLRRYSHFIRPIVSFDFRVEETTKKLDITETTEYTILLNNTDFEDLLNARDKASLENLFEILRKYRFFNLSKLIKKAEEKAELSRIIKKKLGKKIFTFKNYSLDNDKLEWAEDFCFHMDNYESVRDSLNLNTLKEIISLYGDSVKKGLNKFGILNADFSDYRDTKLSYIFSILIDDLASILSEKDHVDAKNLHALVTCLNKVDKVVDPVLILSDDIIKYIKEHKICKESEIIATIPELPPETIKKWASQENLKFNKIVSFTTEDEETYYISGIDFFELISEHNQLILFQPEKMGELTQTERRKINAKMDILYESAVTLLKSEEKIQDYISITTEKVQTLKKIIDDYSKYKKKLVINKQSTVTRAPEPKKRKSILKAIFNFIKSLFRFYAKGEGIESSKNIQGNTALQHREISHETRKVYRKTINKNAPIIPLSDFVELTPENDYLVDKIIKELRDSNLKIIVPIYNARKNLYPKRSQKLLISDIEYLLISPDNVKSAEIIRQFTDSMVGLKIKDEIIPATAIIAIEKYLLTLVRQKRARQ